MTSGSTQDTDSSMTSASPMYVYATEKVGEYYKFFDLTNKSVLTIIGSGDQIINACFFGAKKVTGFDINVRALYFTNLKIAGLKRFNYKQFLIYFGSSFGNASFAQELYHLIRNDLEVNTRNFFDGLYEEISGENFLASTYFRQRQFFDITPTEINAYLENEAAYTHTQECLNHVQIKFLIGQFENLSVTLAGEFFDIINISNIPNYFIRRSVHKVDIMVSVLQSLVELVNIHGAIIFYSYSPSMYEKDVPIASNDFTRALIEKRGIFDIRKVSITSITKKGQDSITILTKKSS